MDDWAYTAMATVVTAPPTKRSADEASVEQQPTCEPCEPSEQPTWSSARSSAEAPWLAAGVQYQRKFTSARSEGSERSEELWLCGSPCASLLCWAHITGAGTCTCEGKLAHILHGACGRAINGALGRTGKSGGCLGTRCRAVLHPTSDDIRAALGAWWQQTRGEPPVFTMVASERQAKTSENTAARGERSLASSAEGGAAARCTLPATRVVELLTSHAADSEYIEAFLAAPFLQEMLEDDRLRSLLAMRSRVKEVSEAYSVCELVRSIAGPERMANGGEGVVVFDVCSGKGWVRPQHESVG